MHGADDAITTDLGRTSHIRSMWLKWLCFQEMCLAFAGILACLDGYMNIAMEQTEEYVNGQLKNKYGDAFIRGNNGERSFRFEPSS